MNLKFKRRYLTYISYIGLFGLFANALKNFNVESIRFLDYLTISGFLFALSSLIWSVTHPYFMTVDKEVIIIYDEFFRIKRFRINDIKKIDEAIGIASKTVFELKNGRKIKFVTSNLKAQDLLLLCEYLKEQRPND